MAVHDHFHRHHARNPGFVDAVASAADDVGDLFKKQDVSTMVSIVYVTASQTFAGAVGGYTTLGPVVLASTPSSTLTPTPTPTPTPSTSTSSTSSHTTLQTSKSSSSSSVASYTSAPNVDSSLPLLAATSTSSTASVTSTTPAQSETSSATVNKAASAGGMSAGGKAGLAIGILFLMGTVLALVLFCFKKRKDRQERLDDEKAADAFHPDNVTRQPSTRAPANAPRLSLRPVTQFLSMSPASATNEKQSAWNRPMAEQETNRNNPFGNHAETIDSANANGPPVVNEVGPGGEIISGVSAAVVDAGAVGLARGASKRGEKPMDFTRQGPLRSLPSPTGTEFSDTFEAPNTATVTAGSAAIAAAGGPATSPVHRVQLDFKPSMDDELELRAGELIRMLHEYDDGWALCIRLDRSRQGVVPRTCLSTRPVKPRPQQNGPRGPPQGMRGPRQGSPTQPRPISPSMNQGGARPMSPAMNNGPPRSQSPSGRPMTPNGGQARCMTPNGQQRRPMTPNDGRPRAGSDAAQMQARRNSPPSASNMNPDSQRNGPPPAFTGAVHRKPVGQAL